MCGINGIFSLKNIDHRTHVSHMNKAMHHRGPDDKGIWSSEHITLGHQRLSIIDLSKAGHQPMHSSDNNLTLVFNGEIYNFKEIRQELNYSFRSDTDTEVIIAAWNQWGISCVNRFNGMFAFSLWDKRKKQLTIIRDRLGIKPLYYYFDAQNLVFSSELRALTASSLMNKEIDPSGLSDYLRYQTVQAPNTILKGIYMLEPGSCLQISLEDFKLQKQQWWSIDRCDIVVPDNITEVHEHVRELFYNSVKRRLVADVPFGAFLSGGIDSSAVVGAMSKVSNRQVKTFNISFAEKQYSEAKYAEYIAHMHQTDHTEINLSPIDFLKELPHALNAIDHPSGDGPNTWMVSKATKEAGITMALSGLGGDELFAGYAIFARMARLDQHKYIWKIPVPLRQFAGNALQKLKPGVSSDKLSALLNLREYDYFSQYAISRQVLLDSKVNDLLNYELPDEHLSIQVINKLNLNKKEILTKVSISEINTYMQNVLLRDSDQMSMAHALEVRVPFLDHELVQFILSVSDRLKYPHSPKKLLVDSFPELLPDYIVNRPKMGFVFPWSRWLQKDLYELADHHIQELSKRPYFNQAEVQKLWSAFNKNNPSVTYSRIWPLVVLNHWMERNEIL
ncbi:asparagine synthase (glutamine-hydrolyzing) [Carboxylicivirga linearis]|uniref:asparagine synthase (glutamine-hydrolyzing) n=1 Tax=Carboxylicivirga linearis TaxID=1628157 RepID=A0ABS5JUN3_9BACT|nr:asparagine synthase (glutamine-hydrolyzing) [Carboxylicivirga linearis]MBS2098533.1 asparagine synthase (glutamine-hydrolyzing) [Carboxylicivirga linearis]